MALEGINPSTFIVPSGLVLLYSSSGTIYKKDNSNITSSISSNVLKVLGLTAAELPCLVYATDLSAAIGVTPVNTSNLVVGSSAKASNVYAKHIAEQKVSKHVFLTEMQNLRSEIKSIMRMVDTMPIASENAGAIVLYTGDTTDTYSESHMYVSDGTTWVDITPGIETMNQIGDSVNTALSLTSATFAKLEDLEEKVNTIMQHLGLV
jgi:hypothetical protein